MSTSIELPLGCSCCASTSSPNSAASDRPSPESLFPESALPLATGPLQWGAAFSVAHHLELFFSSDAATEIHV